MITTVLIERHQRFANQNLIDDIANAVFGNVEQANFSEEFVPEAGRVPNPKKRNFANFLLNGPKLLWAIQYDDKTVGFIIIQDMPYPNAVGISINSDYSGKGIASEAFKQIKSNSRVVFPLFGYTSVRNIKAQSLMEKLGFVKQSEEINFCGENSVKYKLEL